MKTRSLVKPFGSWLLAAVATLTALVGAAEEGAKTPAPDTIGDLLIYPLNHATLTLRWSDLVIYVDPVGGAATRHPAPQRD